MLWNAPWCPKMLYVLKVQGYISGAKPDELQQLCVFHLTVTKYWACMCLCRSLTTYALELVRCIQVCVILSRFSSAVQACWLSVRLTSCSDAAPPHFQQEVYSWALLTLLLFCFKAPSEITSYQILPPLLRPSQTSHWQSHPSSRFQDPLILFNTVKISNFLVRPSLWSSAFNPKRAIFILS